MRSVSPTAPVVAVCVVSACVMAAVGFAAPPPERGPVPTAQSVRVQASSIPASERQALVDLYDSTNGVHWWENGNWNGVVGTECTWWGVSCSPDGTTVQQLILTDNNLKGTLPPTLGNLGNLEYLALGENQLTGSIPAEIGNLTNLIELWLFQNELTGSIPAELGSLTKLQFLILWYNRLTGPIPVGLGSLTNLSVLDLGDNQLTGWIPVELGSLTNLRLLSLSPNHLTGPIPAELRSLTGLQYLWLGGNHLTGSIPTWLGSLTNLIELLLDRNQFSGRIPVELGSLTKLQYLFLGANQLSGPVPTSLRNLTQLGEGQFDEGGLYLWYNALYSTDAELTAFLDSKHSYRKWDVGQTVAPAGLGTGTTTGTSVELSWKPIAYRSGTGGYRGYYSTTSGGPYTADGITANKSASSIIVTGLNPDTVYYFVVRTVTDPGGSNQNTVTSDPSTEVSATTCSVGETSPSISAQPRSQNIRSGEAATLSVTAEGTTPLSYQWFQGSSGTTSNPVGTDGSSYTTPALTTTTSYWVRVSNACSHADSATATVIVGPTSSVWIPVASHISGANYSQWRTDLGLLNTATVTANVLITFYGSDGVASNTAFVPAGAQSILADVVTQVGSSGNGALEVRSDQAVDVTSRTYNLVPESAVCYPNGTQGQDYPAYTVLQGLWAGESARLPQLAENASFRTNIGLTNAGTETASVTVELHDGSGALLTTYTVTLAPGENRQENRPFAKKAAQSNMSRGWAKVTVNSGSGVIAYASVVDNITNDPTTVPMMR